MAALYNRLFQPLFLLMLGIPIGVVSTLCFQSFYFNFSSLPLFVQAPFISKPPPPPPPVLQKLDSNETTTSSSGVSFMHNMSDDELLLRASRVSIEGRNATYKIAFMFLTPGPLPLAPLWDRYFKGHQGLYSIYVHPHPEYNDTTPQDSAFYARNIPSQVSYIASTILRFYN